MQEHFSDIETSFFSSLRCKYDARTSADDNLRIGVPLHTSQTSMDIHLESSALKPDSNADIGFRCETYLVNNKKCRRIRKRNHRTTEN